VLVPLHDRVIVKPLAEQEVRSAVAGLFLASGTARKLHRGVICAMGGGVGLTSGVTENDVVLYEHSKGWDVYDEGEVHVMLPISAVAAVEVTPPKDGAD
jgi:co-chaperonin GroES (HSP10)